MQSTVAKPTEDPFADLDEAEVQLKDLVELLHPDDPMTVTEYSDANKEVATCTTFKVCDNWRQELQEMVVSGHQSKRFDVVEDENEDVDEESDEEIPTSAITTYTELIKLGIDILTVFQSR